MIKYVTGNIFDSPTQVIVNPVNTVGVMGKGLAYSFKVRYPNMFSIYQSLCATGKLKIGDIYLHRDNDYWILLFPTKRNWRDASNLIYIESGLNTFVRTYKDLEITSIAFPKLGCGCGQLNWNDVKKLMEKYLNSLDIEVLIY